MTVTATSSEQVWTEREAALANALVGLLREVENQSTVLEAGYVSMGITISQPSGRLLTINVSSSEPSEEDE